MDGMSIMNDSHACACVGYYLMLLHFDEEMRTRSHDLTGNELERHSLPESKLMQIPSQSSCKVS